MKLTETQLAALDDMLDRADRHDIGISVSKEKDGKYIRTPWELCEEIIENLENSIRPNNTKWVDPEFADLVPELVVNKPLKGKKILVVDTVEFIPVLLSFGAEKCNITYVAPYKFKGQIASALGARVVQQSLLDWKPDMKFDVVVGNPPYTDGTQAANEIYTEIVDRIFKIAEPLVMAMITPENFINGAQKKKTVRERILQKSGFSYINFLNQKRDWNDSISVDTVAWISVNGYRSQVKMVGRNSASRYTSQPMFEYVNGEYQQLHDWLQQIQTREKIRLLVSKKTQQPGLELKISKTHTDSCLAVQGSLYDSHNDQWRVAFGYMRANTCAVVPPGLSIPLKYRYMTFGVNENKARKFAQYMLSGPVRLIMKMTYTSRTLDNPQMSYVPLIDVDHLPEITDHALMEYWGGVDVSEYIKEMVGNEIPF